MLSKHTEIYLLSLWLVMNGRLGPSQYRLTMANNTISCYAVVSVTNTTINVNVTIVCIVEQS